MVHLKVVVGIFLSIICLGIETKNLQNPVCRKGSFPDINLGTCRSCGVCRGYKSTHPCYKICFKETVKSTAATVHTNDKLEPIPIASAKTQEFHTTKDIFSTQHPTTTSFRGNEKSVSLKTTSWAWGIPTIIASSCLFTGLIIACMIWRHKQKKRKELNIEMPQRERDPDPGPAQSLLEGPVEDVNDLPNMNNIQSIDPGVSPKTDKPLS